MLVNLLDDVVKFTPVVKKLCDCERFMIYMEEIQSVGNKHVKKVESNIWRVHYTNPEIGYDPKIMVQDKETGTFKELPRVFMKHAVNKERAQYLFDEAVMWNGFLDQPDERD